MVKLPPPLWTLIYLVIAALISAAAGWPRLPGLPIAWLGVALVVIGVALSVSAAMLFRREGTELNPISPTNSKLVTSGPFQYTRNPMYLSLVILSLGVAIWIGAWPMLLAPIATFATANWGHIPFEEAKMRRQYGEAYDAYTPRSGGGCRRGGKEKFPLAPVSLLLSFRLSLPSFPAAPLSY